MSVTVSMISAQAAASSSSSSGFTWGDAAVIFALVIVGLLILVAFIGRRNRPLTYRPRLRTEHEAAVREAAEEDVEAMEDDSWVTRRDIPGSREDDL